MVTYVEGGWWYYKEANPVDPISNIVFILIFSIGGIFQTSLLGLFFLLGGYFTPKSYDRKGSGGFWKERLMRLGIPLLLYIALINPLMIYTLSRLGIPPWSANPLLQGTFLDYYINIFLSWDEIIDFLTFAGPMWFLLVLLIFTAGYTLWRQIVKLESIKRKIPKELSIPRYFYLLLLAIGLGCLTFLVRIIFPIDVRPLGIPWGQLIQYLMMFSLGVICIRYLWFEKMSAKHVKNWLITILISIVLIYLDFFLALGLDADLNVFSGGANVHAFLFALVDNIICMGVIFVLIKVFYAKFNKQGHILRNLSTSAYHMYLVHPPVLVTISLVFASLVLYPIIKIGLVFLLAVLLCYLVSHFILERLHVTKHVRVAQNN
jgi:glucan biosynthesis protein C